MLRLLLVHVCLRVLRVRPLLGQAVRLARERGSKCGLLRLVSVWPFPEDRVRRLLDGGQVQRFVVPEVNLGQLRREVERITDLPIVRINHAGGAMATPDSILEACA